MKNNRNYNVFFNTHTVSGIIISVALYIIFFAGAFALFREEIQIWQRGKHLSHIERENIDYDSIINNFDKKYDLMGRDININFREEQDDIYVYLMPSKDSLASEKAKELTYLLTNVKTIKTETYDEQYSLGEFFFRLHFLHQIPYIGMYLAGLVSFFFLFAIVTGVIVHWKKIISNFYTFNPKNILKRVWTDAHTALGIIGLPFQFIYAVTGAYFALTTLILIPVSFLYKGDQNKMIKDLLPARENIEWIARSNKSIPSFNTFVKKVANQWDNFNITHGYIKNYGGVNMKYVIKGELNTKDRFVGTARVTYDISTNKITTNKDPNKTIYTEDIQKTLGRLHFANFGNIYTRIIYFVLALITCFVIITGVLVWIEARNKKSMALKQRLYTAKVGHIYLAICLSMFPVSALSFLFVKCTEGIFEVRKTAIYCFFFITWFIFILFFRFKRNNYFTNKYTLLLGAIFGYLIPISNGIVSGNWIWKMYVKNQFDILFVDIFWLFISTIAILIYFKIKPSIKEQSVFAQHPIDYNNIAISKEPEKELLQSNNTKKQNHILMRTKIVILWVLVIFGYTFHHIYGLAEIYFKETLLIEGATGSTPMWAHQWRILMEGTAFLFALLTLSFSNKTFKIIAFIWALIVALFNCYHVTEELMEHSSDISKVCILLLTAVAAVLLAFNSYKWMKNKE